MDTIIENPEENKNPVSLGDLAPKKDATIVIKRIDFEHLLNCLANQKYIDELNEENRKDTQEAIDKAWNRGMFLLNLDNVKSKMEETLYGKLCELRNANIDKMLKCIEEENKGIENEDIKSTTIFKWTQLVWQELWMWVSLTTHSNAIVDEEKCEIKYGQVTQSDFDETCKRRGFNKNQCLFLYSTLKELGIAEELKYSGEK